MARAGGDNVQDRGHFFAIAARAMRQVLVNHARDKQAAKRGGADKGQRVTLSGVQYEGLGPSPDVLAVHEALQELAQLDERQSRIAELRFFAGLDNREVADAIGVSLRTVELDWRMAKGWLAQRLA
jgi:RNA polymerase sigma factor (TIGR02999 family)